MWVSGKTDSPEGNVLEVRIVEVEIRLGLHQLSLYL